MSFRRPLLVLFAVGLFACSKPRTEDSSSVASVSSTTAASATTATVTAIEAKPPSPVDAVKAEPAPKKAKALPGANAKPIRVVVDTTEPETKIDAFRGEDVVLVVPSHVGTDWQITKRDGRLHAPALKHLAAALGPNTDADQYTFETAQIPTDTGSDALVELTNKLAPKEKHTVRIVLMQTH